MSNIKLSVAIITYNQEQFIEQTIRSVVSQEHNYNYEVVVGDDGSSDKTREIIAKLATEFPKIKPIYNEKNLGLLKNYYNVINHCSGEYIMVCGGDDYWLPGKVEAQIEYMEKHSNVALCYTKAQVWYEKEQKFDINTIGKKCNTFNDLMITNDIPALTVCFRNSVIKEYIQDVKPLEKDWRMEDIPTWIWMAYNYKVKFLNMIAGCYRVLSESASHSENSEKMKLFWKSTDDIRQFYAEKYNQYKIYKVYLALRDYRKAVKDKNLIQLKKREKQIPLKYLGLSERIKNKLKCSEKFIKFYNKIR